MHNYKFILLGLVKSDDDGLQASNEILLSPLNVKVTEEYKALVLCNQSKVVPILESEQFSDMVHILKLKYFHGSIQSPKRQRRGTTRDRRLGFSINIRSSNSSDNFPVFSPLKEPMMGGVNDTFSDRLDSEVHSDRSSEISSRSFSTIAPRSRLCLIRDHEDFDKSIGNKKFDKILSHSFNDLLHRKFDYSLKCETRDVKNGEDISNHILLLGYTRGLNQFIDSIREETDIPICIMTNTSSMAEIKNIALLHPNILLLEGDPMDLEHLKNANISKALHVVIPCLAEEDLHGID